MQAKRKEAANLHCMMLILQKQTVEQCSVRHMRDWSCWGNRLTC